MTQSTFIKLPSSLHANLKRLAAARSTTMVGVIAATVADAIAAGEIADETPGFRFVLDLDADRLRLETSDGTLAVLDGATALDLASAIEGAAPGKVIGVLADNALISVRLVGRGVAIESSPTNKDHPVVRAVGAKTTVNDIARRLRSFAASLPLAA